MLLVILLHTHLWLHLQILPVMIPSRSFTCCEELWENAAPQISAASLMARFPSGILRADGPLGAERGVGSGPAGLPGFPATSRSTVGGAQVPHYTWPLEGLAAAFNQTADAIDPFHTESSPLGRSTQM